MTFDVRSSGAGSSGALRLVAATINYNTAGGTADLDTLDAGDVVMRVWAEGITAFNAGTTNTLNLGNGTTATKFLNAQATPGVGAIVPSGGAGPFAAETAAGTLRVAYAQTGTAATAGSCRVYAQITSAAV
jgi:hypothetical protein